MPLEMGSLDLMARDGTAFGTLSTALRALQLMFAIVIMGTDGNAIHVFRGRTVDNHFWFGNFRDHEGVSDAWCFLKFCAEWTHVDAVFLVVARIRFAGRVVVGYLCAAVEAVALLSWLAGFVAVAVNVGSNACPAEEKGCGPIKAATVFGALEWLLFMATATLTSRQTYLWQDSPPKGL
ncbi:hypothetical protein VTK73DRAFT_6193 [Phialemonium thermophilum]|uniref:MARVEL domain-containing protein n=1 Tax=Phialemonium thermophilum TaxID=223376 RepID=A0ABR3WKK4_9PEZI